MTRTRGLLLVVALSVAGLAYRCVYVLDSLGKLNGDDATVALMARHILDGHHYVFFWGQDYMGTLEPYSIAAVATLFGLNDLVLRLTPLVYGLGYMILIGALGRLLFDWRVGCATLFLAALSPPLLALWSSAPRGGYVETLFLGQAVLVLAVLLARERPTSWGFPASTLLGLLAGLALWTNFLSIPFLLVAGGVLWIRDHRAPLRASTLFPLAGFVVGSLPLWIANVRSGFASFGLFRAGRSDASFLANLEKVATLRIPQTFGVRDLVGDEAMLLAPLGHVAMTLLLTLLLVGVGMGLRRLGRAWFRGELPPGGEVCVAFGGVLLALYLPSRYASWSTNRFLLPLYGAVIPLIAAAWVALGRRSRFAAVGVSALILPVWLAGAWNVHQWAATVPPDERRFGRLIETLTDVGASQGFASHESAMVVTYRSEERVVLHDWWIGRYPVEELTEWDPDAFVVERVTPWRDSLTGLGFDFGLRRLDRCAVFFDVRPRTPFGRPIAQETWQASANTGNAPPEHAFDGEIATRWGSGTPQKSGLRFEVDLGRVHEVVGVRLDAGPFYTDWPRGLRVETSSDGRSWGVVRDVESLLPGLVRTSDGARRVNAGVIELRFDPVRGRFLRFVQTGRHQVYDWSIAELTVYETGGVPEPEPSETESQ